MKRGLKARLDALVATHDVEARRANDPVSLVHRYDDDADREVVGLLAALLAFGNVTTIRNKVDEVLAVLGPRPAQALADLDRRDLERALGGFVHRVWTGAHVAALLAAATDLRRTRGTLAAPLIDALDAGEPFREAAARLADALRGPDPDRGLRHLVADPRAGSACKRLLLYLRWMVRPRDGVDLGLWPAVSPASLVIPVDTHVLRIGRNLGLTARKDASWRTAEEITAALRRFDPDDPVKYDFAICHLGVSRDCPSRRVDAICDRCALRPVCLAP